MHTYVAPGGTRFYYNSDLSGEVLVRVPILPNEPPPRTIERDWNTGEPDSVRVEVPAADFLAFALLALLRERRREAAACGL